MSQATMLRTFRRLHPDARIMDLDDDEDTIWFEEKNRQWLMVFNGEHVEGVWDMTPADDNWDEIVQDQQERRAAWSVGD